MSHNPILCHHMTPHCTETELFLCWQDFRIHFKFNICIHVHYMGICCHLGKHSWGLSIQSYRKSPWSWLLSFQSNPNLLSHTLWFLWATTVKPYAYAVHNDIEINMNLNLNWNTRYWMKCDMHSLIMRWLGCYKRIEIHTRFMNMCSRCTSKI